MNSYYEDERCVLYHGDARDVLAALEWSADAVLTDPPYSISQPGVAHEGRPGRGTRNFDFFKGDADWATMTSHVVGIVASAVALIPRAGSFYVFCGHRQIGALTDRLEEAGWSTRIVVWSKACPAPAPPGSGWPSGAELCLYGYRAGRVWNHRPGDGPSSERADVRQLSLWAARQGRSPDAEAGWSREHAPDGLDKA